jgi:heterodisulfide reductase subunit D
MADSFSVRIRRYDPDRQPPAYEQTYQVTRRPELGATQPMTVLEVLEEIQRSQDSSLAFRSSCRISKCGSCAVSLNGRPALACKTLVDGSDLEIGPLPGAPVVKDLIVERGRFEAQQAQTLRREVEAPPEEVAPAPLSADYANLSRCIECLVCDATCPVLSVDAGEAFPGPAWLPAALGGGTGIEERSAQEAFHCLLCAACAAACPSGVAADRLLARAREEVAERGLLPEALSALDARIVQTRNISGEANEVRLGWAANLPRPPAGVGKSQAEVVYFVGCVSALFPRSYAIAQAMVEILEKAGIDYGLLGAQEWCCGYPLAANGELERAREMMAHNLAAVQALGARTLVSTCPSCFDFWKHVYPEVLGRELGLQVEHATEFLAGLLEAGRLPLAQGRPAQVVTYHDPCDLGRKGGVYDAPRRVLAQIPGLTLREMESVRDEALCCGGGGNLESFDPEVVRAVSARRIEQAATTGASTVVSACQQCQRTLFGAAREARLRLRVKDITEIVREALA